MKKVALVTGANRGIGLQVCRDLASQGIDVILTARDKVKGNVSAEMLQNEGLNVRFMQLDVTNSEQIQQVVRDIIDHFGRLDILINNAAVYADPGLNIQNLSSELLESSLQINTIGPFNIIQTVLPYMLHQESGRIINVSSGAGEMESLNATTSAYRLSKFALNGLTIMFADSVERYDNILINAVCPGWVRSDMGGQNAPRSIEKGAETIVWLAMNESQKISGKFFRDKKVISW